MGIITFDTVAHVQRLEKSGFTREQAEAVANANADALWDMPERQEMNPYYYVLIDGCIVAACIYLAWHKGWID